MANAWPTYHDAKTGVEYKCAGGTVVIDEGQKLLSGTLGGRDKSIATRVAQVSRPLLAVSQMSEMHHGTCFSGARNCIVNSELRDQINALVDRWTSRRQRFPNQMPIDMVRERGTFRVNMKLKKLTPNTADGFHQKLRSGYNAAMRQGAAQAEAGQTTQTKPFQRRANSRR